MAPLLYLRSDDGKTAGARLYSREHYGFAERHSRGDKEFVTMLRSLTHTPGRLCRLGWRPRPREEHKYKPVREDGTGKSETEYIKGVVRHISLPSIVGTDLNRHLKCHARVVRDSLIDMIDPMHLRFPFKRREETARNLLLPQTPCRYAVSKARSYIFLIELSSRLFLRKQIVRWRLGGGAS